MATELKTGDASTGSLWNKNSWHWEEKDYNKVAKQILTESLQSAALTTPTGDDIRFTLVEPTGFASVSVRKGKKVVVFEFAISMKFESSTASGTIRIPEFSNDELDPTLRVELEHGDESVKDFIRKSGVKPIKAALLQFVEFINTVETGEERLESDKQRRELELSAAAQAEATKGAEKQQIAAAVKAREQEAVASKTFVEASVWNPNSYHWETRNLTPWAIEWINNKLVANELFTDLVVSGEAENSIRKGKKISLFNLKLAGKFNGNEFSVPSFEADDDEPRVVFPGQDSRAKSQLEQELRKSVFNAFLAELNKQ